MHRHLRAVGVAVFILCFATFTHAALPPDAPTSGSTVRCVNSYSGYQVRTYALPANTLNPGPNQHNSLQTNTGAAQGDIGKTYFTTELTSFNDRQCAGGPCQNNIPGIAHRTWPLGSCVAVCNSRNKKCSVAIVMDRGPNTRLGCRTIDANPGLQAALGMSGGTVPATYQLLSIPPKKCEQIPNLQNIAKDAPQVNTAGYNSPFAAASPFTNVPSPVGFAASPNSFSSPQQQPTLTPTSLAPQNTYPQNVYPQSVTQNTYGASDGGVISSAYTPSQTFVSETLLSGSGGNTVAGGSSTSTANMSAKGAASLIVQPKQLKRGSQGIVSWTSVGLPRDACKVTVLANDAEVAVGTGNEGSRPIKIGTNSSVGTLTFTLVCRDLSDSVIERAENLTVI